MTSPLATYRWHAAGGEEKTIFWTCGALLGQFGLAGLVLMSGINAPYGRYNQASEKSQQSLPIRLLSKCDINPTLAWILQECPTLIAAAVCWSTGKNELKTNPGNIASLFCFVAHYVNRTIIYPLRIKGSKPIPLPVMMMAMSFCGVNGYIQCRSLTRYVEVPTYSWTLPVGIAMWGTGVYINTEADEILRNLRKPGETGYKIPYGGMFKYVSGANFFGEILEWMGYAVSTGLSLPGVTFALCTALNIGPRAVAHHKWYLEKFKDSYPKERTAVIPFLF